MTCTGQSTLYVGGGEFEKEPPIQHFLSSSQGERSPKTRGLYAIFPHNMGTLIAVNKISLFYCLKLLYSGGNRLTVGVVSIANVKSITNNCFAANFTVPTIFF
jgi:hypothetical protein